MSHVFPLIRAAALVPFLRWMRANGRPVEARLRAADLASFPWDDPDRPIALARGLAFLRGLGAREGPDIGCRVVSDSSIGDLATLGRVMLGARSPREALARVAVAMPHHCTHERFAVVEAPGGATVRDDMAMAMDETTRHLVQQYVAALIRVLCSLTGYRGEPLARVELLPHPRLGLDHLRSWLGPGVVAGSARTLAVFVPAAVLDRPFPHPGRDRAPWVLPSGWSVMRGDGSYAGTARVLVDAMLDDGIPSVERLAAAAGTSLRTLQRRLAADGASFSALLDDARRTRALDELAAGAASIGTIATELGYAGQPAFTRAVRRWAAAPPRHLRLRGLPGA